MHDYIILLNTYTISITQHNTSQHNTTQHNTTQHNAAQHNTTQHNTTQHNTTQHNTMQHNTTQHNKIKYIPYPATVTHVINTIRNHRVTPYHHSNCYKHIHTDTVYSLYKKTQTILCILYYNCVIYYFAIDAIYVVLYSALNATKEVQHLMSRGKAFQADAPVCISAFFVIS